jgi:Domain of unknown function (DUF932)
MNTINRNTTLRSVPSVSLEDLMQDVAEKSISHHDIQVTAEEVYIDPVEDMLIVQKHSYSLKYLALSQIANKFQMPAPYLAKCPAALRAQNINHWLQEDKKRELLLRCDGDSVRAVLSQKYAPISNTQMLEYLKQTLGPKTKLRYELSEEQMMVQVVNIDGEFVGDTHDRLIPGINLRNSEVGLSSAQVAAMIYRTICLNGLIMSSITDTWKRRHVGKQDFLDEVRKAIFALRDAAKIHAKEFVGLRTVKVKDVHAVFAKVAETFTLTETQLSAIQLAFNVEPGDTLYECINAITRAGNATDLKLEERRQLQEVGGKMLDLSKSGNRWLK